MSIGSSIGCWSIQSAEGVFQVKVNIPTHFGGTGKDQFAWMLCDAPSIVYALAKLGVKDRRVKVAAKYLAEPDSRQWLAVRGLAGGGQV